MHQSILFIYNRLLGDYDFKRRWLLKTGRVKENNGESYTVKIGKHIPTSFPLPIICKGLNVEKTNIFVIKEKIVLMYFLEELMKSWIILYIFLEK